MMKETQNSMADQPDSCLAGMPESSTGGSGRNPRGTVAGASSVLTRKEHSSWKEEGLMEAVVGRGNLLDSCHCWICLSLSAIRHEPPYTEPYVR